jgi:hypothetical protein
VAGSAVASAAAIDVSYTVAGSAGSWSLDFAVTNNMTAWPMQDVYHFGVLLSGNNVTSSPGDFVEASSFWTNFFAGGAPLFYNNTWQDSTYSDLPPGTTISGFKVGISDAAPPASVQWFAYSATLTSDPADGYTGGSTFTNDGFFAGFEGTASRAAATGTPEPETLTLAIGSLGVFFLNRRRRR